MIPLIFAVVAALIAFFAACFVIFRIVLPILPPSPFSRKVAPAEFGLPNFRNMSLPDKCHIWLACLDILSLVLLVWQAASDQNSSAPVAASDPLTAVRLWLLLTLRPTFLLILLAITLLHLRLGRPVSFGTAQWMIFSPALVIILASTALASVLAATGLRFPLGLTGYTCGICLTTAAVFLAIIYTLMNIKRNLASDHHHQPDDSWPPMREVQEDKSRPSFATEDVDALRDGGASWITSDAGSRRPSISEWSFTTSKTTQSTVGGRPQSAAHPSVPTKSSFWFKASSQNVNEIPPVPPLPSPYAGPISPTAEALHEEDPFRRAIPQEHVGRNPRWRFGSQTSWLSSTDGSHTTMTAWSFSTRHGASSPNLDTRLLTSTAVSRPATPAMAEAQVLGGYGYAPQTVPSESQLTLSTCSSVNVSLRRSLLWLISFFLPVGLSIPYIVALQDAQLSPPLVLSVLFVIAAVLPSPLLSLNLLLRSPLPIPLGLFDANQDLPPRASSPAETVVGRFSHEYKRSMSTSATVVEGRRSGDVWLSKGEAVDGKSRLGRAVEMLNPRPRLSVMPLENPNDDNVPPIRIRDDSTPPVSIHNTPHSQHSAQFGRLRKESKTSSHLSGADESVGHSARIMVAQRHYSSLAQTFKVASSPGNGNVSLELASGSSSDVEIARRSSGHLRSRSVSTITKTPTTESFSQISLPPSCPLPPTPPNVRAARLAELKHKKSFSSGYSFGAVRDVNEIDALTAGVLPLLVPGLKVGKEMTVTKGGYRYPAQRKEVETKKAEQVRHAQEFGGDFSSSPQFHSTPARTREPRSRKHSAFRHFSLPSLGLGKDGMNSWSAWTAEVGRAIDAKAGQLLSTPRNIELNYRNTVFGTDSIPSSFPHTMSVESHGPNPSGATIGRSLSTRRLGLRAEVPHGVERPRTSMGSVREMLPPSAASTATFVDYGPGFDSGPQAESTPHNTAPGRRRGGHSQKENGRSSIVYIKSEGESSVVPITPSYRTGGVKAISSKPNPLSPTPPSTASNSSKGLRRLSLLRTLDTNVDSSGGSSTDASLKKVLRSKRQINNIRSSKISKNIKQLRLANTENVKPLPQVPV